MLSDLIRALRKFIGLEKDVERITRPLTKILNNLETYAAQQEAESAKRAQEAARLKAATEAKLAALAAHNDNAAAAVAQKEKLAAIFS